MSNHLSLAQLRLEQAITDAAQQRARVVLLRGSGRAFCAGADLKERQGMDLAARLAHNAAIRAAIEAMAAAKFVRSCWNSLT